nr:PREDICTED: taste receptor type 2 member 13-like [Anolis carolinensis]|eukprot:XP_016852427.1 PREDICTED: taste receptor type 2 member 13-like [Anolis carolinensis]
MVAILGNGFIIVVSGNRWLQARKMVPSDFLLTSLSISRVFLHVTFGLIYVLELIVVLMNFIISMIATILLLTSLWKHIRNLKKSEIGAKDLSAQVHINVMKPLVFYIFLYLSYFAVSTRLISRQEHKAAPLKP